MDFTATYYEQNSQAVFERINALSPIELYKPFLSKLVLGAHILDAGCGSGRDNKYFIEQGYRVTAVDASAALGQLASQYIGQPVLQMRFQALEFQECFDGIWASASLLHVGRAEIDDVLTRLSKALKPDGLLYASFVYGDGEKDRGGLLFSDYTQTTFTSLIQNHSELAILDLWQTEDLPGRRNRR